MALSLNSVDVDEFDLGNARLIILQFVPLTLREASSRRQRLVCDVLLPSTEC
jgi:hypothetical protein